MRTVRTANRLVLPLWGVSYFNQCSKGSLMVLFSVLRGSLMVLISVSGVINGAIQCHNGSLMVLISVPGGH